MWHVSDWHKQRAICRKWIEISPDNKEQIMEVFNGHHVEGDVMLTGHREHPQDAHIVMQEAGALFDVAYPASAFTQGEGDIHIPRVQTGVNIGRPLHKYVVRTDTDEVLGLHSHKYAETDGYGFIADMAETLFPEKTTSCTVFGVGERVAVTQELIAPIDLGSGDWIQPQICWISSYNGLWATSVYDLTSRLFCSNQLIGQPLVKVRHTKNHDKLLELRVRILEGSIARAEALVNMARVLRDQHYTDNQFAQLMFRVLPIADLSDRKVANVQVRHQYCRTAWDRERQEFGAGTRWMAYNAIQGAEQHRINGCTRGSDLYDADRAMERAINGRTPLAERALALLTA